jgi:hypothetical protein
VRCATPQSRSLPRRGKTRDNLPMGRALASVMFAAALASPASADVLKLFGEVHGGGMDGWGVSGDQKNSAFFQASPHVTYGALVGVEVLLFDALIEHHQYTDGSRLTTWTQFGIGIHQVFDTGSDQDRKAGKGSYVEFGANLWFGLGTGQQVVPPLDNAQITDKGFLAEARLGFGKHLSSNFDLGLIVPVSYGFFFKSGNGAGANNTSNQYRGAEVEGLLALRAKISLL